MELVYLWVEDYKNIKKQGFNFSPRFECEYDEENKKLEIIDKEKTGESYPKNFFGENINITAIVGENGSGKSTLLEYFYKLDDYIPHFHEYYNTNCEEIKNFICVFNDENGCQFMSNIQNIQSNKYKVKKVKHRYIIDYSHNNEKSSTQNIITSININKKYIIDLMLTIYTKYESYPSHFKKENYNFELTTFFYLANKIEVIPKDIKEVYKWSMNMAQFHNDDIAAEIENNREDLFNDVNDNYHLFLIMWYIENIGFNRDILTNKKSLIHEYSLYDDFNEKDKLSEKEFKDYYSKKFILLNQMTTKEKEIYFKTYKDYFEFDFIDSKNRRYNNLSHGEQNLYGQFLNIFYHLVIEYSYEKIREELFFSLDEPDIALHPYWQKRYIQELISLSSKFDKKIHFIITSHSPFILSDLPKENVIFLEKDEKTGECINSTNKADINPFGANIHTLLSHGFFMKDGLMGEFAKGKIDGIIKNLKDKNYNPSKEEKEKLLTTIKIIGEEFLKTKLLDMYYKKFDDDFIKKQRKEELEKLQEMISKELEQL